MRKPKKKPNLEIEFCAGCGAPIIIQGRGRRSAYTKGLPLYCTPKCKSKPVPVQYTCCVCGKLCLASSSGKKSALTLGYQLTCDTCINRKNERICAHCGKVFASANHLYCSWECFKAANKQTCIVCGKKYRKRNNPFCSVACRKKAPPPPPPTPPPMLELYPEPYLPCPWCDWIGWGLGRHLKFVHGWTYKHLGIKGVEYHRLLKYLKSIPQPKIPHMSVREKANTDYRIRAHILANIPPRVGT